MLFTELQTRQDVANFFNIKDCQLRYILYGTNPDSLYVHISIPKRSGDYRNIYSPCQKLKHLQQIILKELEKQYIPKKCTYGFIKGKDYIQNAKYHLNKKIILNIDLQDYFTQIHFGRVQGILMAKPYCLGREAAMVIAQICCYKGFLPQGAPTSPILANMVTSCLDTKLIKLAKKYKFSYSRYADDITFSSFRSSFPRELITFQNNELIIGEELNSILNSSKFIINPAKVHISRKSNRQEVTGVIINKKPNIRRVNLNELRIVFYKINVEGIYQTAKNYIIINKYKYTKHINNIDNEEYICNIFEAILRGKINHIRNVCGKYNAYYIMYAKKFNICFQHKPFLVNEEEDLIKSFHKYVYIVESSFSQGTCFLAKGYGIITCAHVIEDDNVYKIFNHNYEEFHRFLSNQINIKDDNIDYACVNYPNDDGLKISECPTYETGKKVTIIGYPAYNKGDSIYIESCRITGKKSFQKQSLVSVSGRIIHGASGGVVLDERKEVIGVIRVGEEEKNYDHEVFIPSFIPIKDIINSIKEKK